MVISSPQRGFSGTVELTLLSKNRHPDDESVDPYYLLNFAIFRWHMGDDRRRFVREDTLGTLAHAANTRTQGFRAARGFFLKHFFLPDAVATCQFQPELVVTESVTSRQFQLDKT